MEMKHEITWAPVDLWVDLWTDMSWACSLKWRATFPFHGFYLNWRHGHRTNNWYPCVHTDILYSVTFSQYRNTGTRARTLWRFLGKQLSTVATFRSIDMWPWWALTGFLRFHSCFMAHINKSFSVHRLWPTLGSITVRCWGTNQMTSSSRTHDSVSSV